MNTEQMKDREKRLARFLETEIGKAFLAYKTAFVRLRKAQLDDDYAEALQDMQDAEDRLMELTEAPWTTYEPITGPPVMRRIEVRPMTKEEMAIHQSDKAW